MNVLLFVTAMIMVLSMLTYTKLELYHSFSLLQSQFTRYMTEIERGTINTTAEWWYENSRSTQSSTSPQPNPQAARSSARSRLSFLVFIDKAKQAQYAQVYPKIVLLTKKLIFTLYKNQPFFQQFVQRRPDIVDGLLASLMIADSLPKEQKIKKATDLANLNLEDPLLNTFFYYVLKGTPFAPPEQTKTVEPYQPLQTDFIIKLGNGETEDEDGDPDKSKYYVSPSGYSLLDCINVDDAVKIRVFLASKPLLLAIFDHPDIVNAIIAMRNDLYHKVTSGAVTANDASTQFQNLFASKSDPNFNDTILDFKVTKTNPKNYE